MNPHLPRRALLRAGLASCAAPLLQSCGGGGIAPPTEPARYQKLTAPLPVTRHASAPTPDGGVLVIGGERGEITLSHRIERYDPVARSFSTIGELEAGREHHTATALADGAVLVVGGYLAEQIGPLAELIDPASGRVVPAGLLSLHRRQHASVLLADGRVLVCGGVARWNAEIWDPATRRWRVVDAPMVNNRAGASATLLADGRVLIAGGGSRDPHYSFAEIFDPRREAFSALEVPGEPRRAFHAAHAMSDGSVLIAGGELAPDVEQPLAGVLRYLPAQGLIRRERDLGAARSLCASVRAADDSVLFFGGQDGAGAHSASAERYHPERGGSALPRLPEGRAWHSVDRLRDGSVLIVGGERYDGGFVADALVFG